MVGIADSVTSAATTAHAAQRLPPAARSIEAASQPNSARARSMSAIDRQPTRSVERHALVPVRDAGRQAELADPRFERRLRIGVAVDDEHPAGVSGGAWMLAS